MAESISGVHFMKASRLTEEQRLQQEREAEQHRQRAAAAMQAEGQVPASAQAVLDKSISHSSANASGATSSSIKRRRVFATPTTAAAAGGGGVRAASRGASAASVDEAQPGEDEEGEEEGAAESGAADASHSTEEHKQGQEQKGCTQEHGAGSANSSKRKQMTEQVRISSRPLTHSLLHCLSHPRLPSLLTCSLGSCLLLSVLSSVRLHLRHCSHSCRCADGAGGAGRDCRGGSAGQKAAGST